MGFPGGNVIRVTPTLDTSAYDANDVMFDSTEIPNAVASRGGVSRLLGITLLNLDDAANDIELVFTEKQANLGTVGSAVASGSLWTNALAKASKVLGIIQIDHSDNNIDLINNLIYSTFKSNAGDAASGNHWPMLLKADEGSTSVYFAGKSIGTPTTPADGYEFIFHIEYL